METTIKALTLKAKAAREHARDENYIADHARATAKRSQQQADKLIAEAAEYEHAIEVLMAVENLKAGKPGNSTGVVLAEGSTNGGGQLVSYSSDAKVFDPADLDGWRPWFGGTRPVTEDTLVDIYYRRVGGGSGRVAAGQLTGWLHKGADTDIIAYRISK